MKELPMEEFEDHVGLIWEVEEIEALGLSADDDNGSFDTSRLAELQDYCLAHPEFHLVTSLDDDTYVNEIAVANRVAYFLARGSLEPALGRLEPGES